jgi:hypothetical protein
VHLLRVEASSGTSDHVAIGFLGTLGGCRHLDGLEKWRTIEWLLVIVACSDQVLVSGSCAYSSWEIMKGNCSGLLMACVSSPVLVLMASKCWARHVMPIGM